MFWWIAMALLLLSLLGAAAAAWRFYRVSVALGGKLDRAKKQRSEISKFLARFSASMEEDNGVTGAMNSAARYVAEETDAESVGIYEINGTELRATGVYGNFPLLRRAPRNPGERQTHLLEDLRREKAVLGKGFLGGVAAHREIELVPDASMDHRFIEYPEYSSIGSVMAMPLMRDGAPTGLVVAVNNRLHQGGSFTEGQLDQLRLLAGQVQMVNNLVKVYSEINRRDRIDQEIAFARNLQLSLLPPEFPAWQQFAICARTRSAKEVNGDFYDFVEIDQNRLLVIIGDACGKGIPACMLTAMARSYARCLAADFTTLGEFLMAMNGNLNRDTESDRFLTMGCCLLDTKNSLLEFGRAGHTDLVQFVHNHIRAIQPDGSALGILPNDIAHFDTICLAMPPGTTLMMYSDGITEALNRDNEEFGHERMIAEFKAACEQGGTPQTVVDRVMETVENYESEQGDDQTIVLIRHMG